jgi:hypothetical protein
MATTTPNFGWPVPTSTDLVKDGAIAIEALGDGIDASLLDLKGGTTGQVLAKASNTDLDYSWTTPQVGDITAITASSPLTGGGTSGDVTIGILSGTTSNLGAVQLSTSVSSTSTSLAATASAVKSAYDLATSAPISNPVLNSAMQIWQRGTSVAGSTTAFSADRWQSYRSAAGSTFSRQATNDTTNLPNIQYCARVQRDSGNTSTVVMAFFQNFESINSIPYAGKTVTFSFYARAGANYSPTSSLLQVQLISGTGTDQNVITGYTGSTNVINQAATLTTTWQRFSYTGTVATTATELVTYFSSNPTGTAGANDYYEITGVQLDIGSVALPFRTYAGTIQGELAACQRYYWRENLSTFVGSATNGFSTSTTAFNLATRNPVAMRTGSTTPDYSSLRIVDTANSAYTVTNVVSLSGNAERILSNEVTVTVSGATAGRWGYLQGNASTGYLGFSAEL